ncbi:DNA mismatch repair endonuclease MutL [Methylophaga sp. OBS3]|uniref:DNA mismatch repair endonuclease MutL n=1 Tax=Methylophaga sp. OBS3 TaxID=2991934 RepID=UPI00225944BB|nr:DNA mismatch repair endonuclease MutL [Methylophaga sp. OBS3]MCX4190451.1 DNA mismatch repair endonuclease MutL [Methylophaga sp. OBS3]
MSEAKRIHALPLQLANQIAAGEVIERPASVVKELVENSLDAGARQITIRIDGAGSQLISIRDDGTGIHPEDLPLALSRHATSKLTSSEDLSHIASLGFRGEALPSIASVAHLTLTSRQKDSDCGWQVKGEDSQVSPTAHPLGTTVEVRDLFFNLPARRRFLRSARTEQQHILTTLQRLALSRFELGIDCQINGQQKLALPIADNDKAKQQRIAKLCGSRFANQALIIDKKIDFMHLTGWLAPASAHRPHNDIQHFFINGRVIRDRLISHAVRQAFAESLPAGRHPAYVLYLEVPLDRVDVNVHPTKHEVRFREARLIHGLITGAVRDALAETDTLPLPMVSTPEKAKPANKVVEQRQPYQAPPLLKAKPEITNSALKVVANSYALVEKQHETWLIDLGQADREIRQQQLHKSLESGQVTARPVLVPIDFPATNEQKQAISEHANLLSNCALSLVVTQNGIQIRQFPALLGAVSLHALFDALIAVVSSTSVNLTALQGALLKLLPAQAAFNQQQAETLIKQLEHHSWQQVSWARQLDKTTLADLFSTKVHP